MRLEQIITSPFHSLHRMTQLTTARQLLSIFNNTPWEHCDCECHWEAKFNIVTSIIISSYKIHLKKKKATILISSSIYSLLPLLPKWTNLSKTHQKQAHKIPYPIGWSIMKTRINPPADSLIIRNLSRSLDLVKHDTLAQSCTAIMTNCCNSNA